MANNSHKYYLQIDGAKPIDFNRLEGFPDITDFLSLSLFTGLFEGEEELLDALKNMGLIPSINGDEEISIVKKLGNARTGYNYKYVTNDVMYKSASRIMSASNIERFLNDHGKHYTALRDFFEDYVTNLNQLISYFEMKISRLENVIQTSAGEEKKNAVAALESKKNSLKNFIFYSVNLKELLNIIGFMSRPDYFFDREMEYEYLSRIGIFVDAEVHYIKGKNRTPNYRGLVKLAIKVDELLQAYPELEFNNANNTKFHEEKARLLKCYKDVILKGPRLVFGSHKISQDLDSMVDEDPDSFMLLKPEDFERLSSPDDEEETRVSIELAIENLKEAQAKQGKL